MQSRIWGAVLFVLFLAALIPNASAFLYSTTTGKLVYEAGTFPKYAEPYSPKIACNPEATKCVLLVYENNAFLTRGVKVIYSTDSFTDCSFYSSTCFNVLGGTIPDDYSSSLPGAANATGTYTDLPYGVMWNTALSKFIIYSGDDIYTVSSGGSFAANRTVTINTGTFSGVSCAYNAPIGPLGLGFYNESEIYYFALPFCSSTAMKNATFLANVNTGTISAISIGQTVLTCAAPSTPYAYIDAFRAVSTKLTSSIKYEYYLHVHCHPGNQQATAPATTYGFTGDYLGLHYYDPNFLSYLRTENLTANVSAGIWTSESSDLSSYSTPGLLYGLNGAIAEQINTSSVFYNGAKKFLVWERYSNSTGNGIYMEIETNKPVTVESPYSMTATLSTSTYVTSGTGTIFLLYTPNDTASITFDSVYTPGAYTVGFDFSGCATPMVSAIHENAPYTYTIKVLDQVTNQPMSAATVYMGATSTTTDANGFASFTIQPIDTPTFTLDKQGCNYYLHVNGTPTQYLVSIAKTGYVTTNYYITPAAKRETYGGNFSLWDFEKNRTLTIAPNGVLINVHILTDDNIEIFPSSYTAYVSGNNNETWAYKGTLRTLRNYLSEFPAVFLMFDNRTSYTATITLDYPGGANITQTEAVTVNNEYDIDIQIPYSLAELPCAIEDDCGPTYCDASGFYNYLNGCQESRCIYTETDCISPSLCDPGIGCFETDTGTACTRDLDCNNSCVDADSMLLEKCGDDGYCKQIYRECSEGCNVTVGICEESKDCILGDSISAGWLYASGLIDHRKTLNCDLAEAGKSYCQHGPTLALVDFEARGKTFNDLRTYPDGWTAILSSDGETLQLGDYILSCSDSCGASIEFCTYGCSDSTNTCLSPSPGGPASSITSSLTNLGLGWVASIWWYVLSMIVGVVVLYLFASTAGFDNAVGWEMFGIIIIIMMGVGLAIPEVSLINPFVGWLLIIACSLALASKFVPSK